MGRWIIAGRGSRVAGLGILLAVGCGLSAAGTLEAQSEYQPHGFLSTRYDTHTSSNMFFGYTMGPVTPMIALVSNPRTTYREHIVGVVRFETFTKNLGLTWAVAGAKAIDSWYGQLYILPSITVGRLHYDAQFELYVPLQDQGVHQFAMNPGNLMFDVTPKVAIGAVGVWSEQTGAPYQIGGGPSMKIRVPKGSISLDGILGVTRWDSEARVTFFTQY